MLFFKILVYNRTEELSTLWMLTVSCRGLYCYMSVAQTNGVTVLGRIPNELLKICRTKISHWYITSLWNIQIHMKTLSEINQQTKISIKKITLSMGILWSVEYLQCTRPVVSIGQNQSILEETSEYWSNYFSFLNFRFILHRVFCLPAANNK